MDDITFARLTRQLEALLGLDLRAYKQQQMRRRIASFLARQGDGDIDRMLDRLGRDGALLQSLRDMLTINVTEFFRDPPQWQVLQQQVLPGLLEQRRALRIWSAGCSHGQEPLSLAMTLDRLGALKTSRILGTDFDHASLARARAGGPYGETEMGGMSRADRDRHFTKGPQGYTASRELCAGTRYAELNLLQDRFDVDFDLILCRNVMIYFEGPVKTALVRRFCEALRPGGVLFIGSTEALLGRDIEGFERLGGNFYRRTAQELRRTA